MTFKEYIKSIKDNDSPEGDFAVDAFRDKSFPWKKADNLKSGKASILEYLREQQACREAKEAFLVIWRNFKKMLPEDCS